MSTKPSQLINDLSNVPNIISSLGLGIAAAQKAFNLDYLNGIERLLIMANTVFGTKTDAEKEKFKDMFINMVQLMAPYRYQFTETTLSVRLDLAQSRQRGSSASLGMSVGAVALSAAMTEGLSSKYQAGAEVKTVLQSIPFDPGQVATLITNAHELTVDKKKLENFGDPVDQAYMDKSKEILAMIPKPKTS